MAFDTINLDSVDNLREVRDGPNRNEIKDQYNVGSFEYPTGLRNAPDLQHYIGFLINVREKSSLGESYRTEGKLFSTSTFGERQRTALDTEDITRGGQAILNNAGTLGLAFGALANAKRAARGEIFGAAASTLATGAGARLVAEGLKSIDSKFLTQGNSTYRLKDVITLHIENSPSVRYGINYTDKDLGSITGLITQASAEAAMGKMSEGFGKEIISRMAASLIKLPSIIPGGGTLADIRELSTRQKINPFKEVLFESVDYRSFNFKYRFFPKDKGETTSIQNIIKLFKMHMHPEVSNNKFFFTYPSEFEIKYYYRQAENTFINSIGRCALVGMEVEYGGDQFATFEDGSPVEIGLTLSFRELEQVTSQGVKNYGY
jgi:hypothetical protein